MVQLCQHKKDWVDTEWKKFKRHCINPEVLPGTYEGFCKYLENHSYYPAPSCKFKLIHVGKSQNLMPIDYGIADLIEKLNREGYITKFCCSGHSREFYRDGYIYFDSESMSTEKLSKIKDLSGVSSEIVKFTMDTGWGDIIRFRPKVNLVSLKIHEEKYYKILSDTIQEALWYESK